MSEIHQPAPWSRDKYGNLVDANGESVYFRGVSTLCAGSDDRIAMAEANTDLAKLAPELLQALGEMVNEFQRIYPIYYYAAPWGHETNVPLIAAKALIAKARGAS